MNYILFYIYKIIKKFLNFFKLFLFYFNDLILYFQIKFFIMKLIKERIKSFFIIKFIF
jgi:hypothetical protein